MVSVGIVRKVAVVHEIAVVAVEIEDLRVYTVVERGAILLFPATHAPAIKPLGNTDINGSIAQGYNVDIEYHDDEEVDDKTLICRGLAKTP